MKVELSAFVESDLEALIISAALPAGFTLRCNPAYGDFAVLLLEIPTLWYSRDGS